MQLDFKIGDTVLYKSNKVDYDKDEYIVKDILLHSIIVLSDKNDNEVYADCGFVFNIKDRDKYM